MVRLAAAWSVCAAPRPIAIPGAAVEQVHGYVYEQRTLG